MINILDIETFLKNAEKWLSNFVSKYSSNMLFWLILLAAAILLTASLISYFSRKNY